MSCGFGLDGASEAGGDGFGSVLVCLAGGGLECFVVDLVASLECGVERDGDDGIDVPAVDLATIGSRTGITPLHPNEAVWCR